MAMEPAFAAFAELYNSGEPQAVFARLPGDLETPVSVFLKIGEGCGNSFLLESVQGGEARGRYSIIGIKPDLIWRSFGERAEISRGARADADAFSPETDTPLQSLRKLVVATRMSPP